MTRNASVGEKKKKKGKRRLWKTEMDNSDWRSYSDWRQDLGDGEKESQICSGPLVIKLGQNSRTKLKNMVVHVFSAVARFILIGHNFNRWVAAHLKSAPPHLCSLLARTPIETYFKYLSHFTSGAGSYRKIDPGRLVAAK